MNVLHQVIIIGAGPSGIGAAYTLSKLKIPHLILQSRAEIGGRLRTTTIDGSTIHLGACYIHSPNKDHSILNVMKELNIKPLPNNYANQSFLQEGLGQMSKKQLEEGQLIHKKLVARIVERAKSSQQDCSLLTVVQEFFNENKHLPQKIVEIAKFLIKFQAFFQASDLQYLSVKAYNHQRTEDDYIPPGGYLNVLKSIYNHFKPKVIFNQKVILIDYSKQHIRIVTQNNEVYKAKYLISSLPLGVLKKNVVTFNPPLPQTHQNAIQNITFGVMNKIYLKFQEDFWTKKGDWTFLFTKESFKYNVIVNQAETSKNVMCVKVGGFQNLSLFQKSDQQIIEQVLNYLRKFYKEEKMKLKAYYITRWHKDEHTYGSYSSLKPGENRENIIQISKPIDQKIWFVGQHCNRQKLGYAHAAFQTGQKAANEIAKLTEVLQAKL